MQGEGMGREGRAEQWAPLRKASESWCVTSKGPGVKAGVVAGAGHAVSLDINVLLEGTPPRAHPVTDSGGRNKGTLFAPRSNIKHNGLCMHAHSQQKVIHQKL